MSTNPYEVMQTKRKDPRDNIKEQKKIDPEFVNKTYVVCDRESHELLECIIKHANDIEECDKEYQNVQHCERKHY